MTETSNISVDGLKTVTFLDFMSKIRQYTNLSHFNNFGAVVNSVVTAGIKLCPQSESLHILCDSNLDHSIKEGERLRRAGNLGAIDLSLLNEYTPIPQQIDKFWNSSSNKIRLLQLARKVAVAQVGLRVGDIIVSVMVVNQEQVPAVIYSSETESVEIPELTSWQEEADERIVPHAFWAVHQGCERLVVISNDTDSIVRLLHSAHSL